MARNNQTTGRVIRVHRVTREEVRSSRDTLYVFGDNMARKGLGGQAAAMRGEPNTIGVPTKWKPSRDEAAFFTDADADLPQVREAIIGAFQQMRAALQEGRDVVIPADGLGTGLAELTVRAPRIHRAIEARIADLEERGI